MVWKKLRNSTGISNELQAQIILIRGLTDEGELLYQRHYANCLNKGISTINYNVVQLKKKGLMTDNNFLTYDGKSAFQKIKGYVNSTKKLRAHKIFGKLILAYPYSDFEKVRNKYKQISNNPKYKGFRFDFKGCMILFYSPKTIVYYLPDIFAESVEELHALAIDNYINPLISYLEKMFQGLKVNDYTQSEITMNHIAYQNHPLAELFKKHNKGYRSDRIHIDHSHGTPELETIHKKHAAEDMEKILEYEKIIKKDLE